MHSNEAVEAAEGLFARDGECLFVGREGEREGLRLLGFFALFLSPILIRTGAGLHVQNTS